MSGVCAQAYDQLGALLATIIAELKILVSQSTEITSNQELDHPIEQVDKPFDDTCTKLLQNLPKVKDIEPFNKGLIPKGFELECMHQQQMDMFQDTQQIGT